MGRGKARADVPTIQNHCDDPTGHSRLLTTCTPNATGGALREGTVENLSRVRVLRYWLPLGGPVAE